MRIWATAHAVDDFYQGLVPAAVPYFVLQRHFSYVEASGLALAATLGSALPQVPIGLLADRHRLRWMSPLGISLAGIGAGLSGLVPTYPLVFALLLLAGLGIAMFHPPAGRDARRVAGGSATAMSYFAAGGSVGFFVGPALVTPALDKLGIGATALFIPPAVLMGFVLLRHQSRASSIGATRVRRHGRDRVGRFAALTGVEIVRSTISTGLNTFVSLYWIRNLGASSAFGGLALTLELGGGVVGTLLGGRIADRVGMVRTVQIGNAAMLPALWLLLACDDRYAALPLVLLVGLISNIPFAVLVKLGQDYLPSRPGTAAGVTLGLALSAGGLFMPLLGLVAERHGPRGALVVLACVTVIAVLGSTVLREPADAAAPPGSPGNDTLSGGCSGQQEEGKEQPGERLRR
ncbi:MFS transporter [Kitasatospora kifunensis]|uniref:FSR family fosmidomycin resistance protein-like MFS transporter n=1 Tax=Kitasatospora kifunensis TaxID=58351 RepID=A0A7W7VZA7_KITKI|nr:MFS transporter [Kitasatospora kifunensis]MBB4928366.1 FSR family fosmidomycin resistance protein-like MFS transporter [Kitasatospora kifunensis]